MKNRNLILSLSFAAMASFACSCSSDDDDTTPDNSLYMRVGGTTMVSDPKMAGQMIEKGRLTLRSVVDSSIMVVAADPKMTKYFPVLFAELGAGNTTGLSALSENFTDFLSGATGAKNTAYAYTGKNMKDAHDPAKNNRMTGKINSEDFDRFVGDIGTGLAKNGVTTTNNAALVNDLVALLNTTKSDIVQNPTATPNIYTRVGGTTMVADPKNAGQTIEQGRLTLRSVVDSSILVVAADPAMAPYFPVLFAELGAGNTTGLAALSKSLTDFFSSATGSTNSAYAYTGKSMKDAHDPALNNRIAQKINGTDFDKFVGDIGTGLARNGVTSANNPELVYDLVTLLNTTKSDIVQR